MTTAQTDDPGRLAAAREKVSDTAHAALDTAGDAFVAAREKAGTAYSAALDRTGAATRAAAEGIESNPLVALIGGIALGAVVGALLPRSQKESELLGSIGVRLADAVREAVGAAKQASFATFDEAGLSNDSIQGQVGKLLDSLAKAATASAGAAFQAARKSA